MRSISQLYVADDPNNIYGKEIDYSSDSVFIRASRELALAGPELASQIVTCMFLVEIQRSGKFGSHIMEVKYVFNNLKAQASRRIKI